MADIDEVKPTHPALPSRRVKRDKYRPDPDEHKRRKEPPPRENDKGDPSHIDEYV